MKNIIRLTENDLVRLVKRILTEQDTKKDTKWDNFIKVMMTMNPKPKLGKWKPYKSNVEEQSLNWFNDSRHFYSVSILNDSEIMIAMHIKYDEITKWWKSKGYNTNLNNDLLTISISYDNAEKVKNDLTEFFKTISPM